MDLSSIRRLAELAKKATPDARTIERAPMDAGFDIMSKGTDVAIASYLTERDAKYYAACDPQTIIALCAEVERLRARLKELADDDPCHGPDDRWCPSCGLGGTKP